jgi:TolB-like protein/Flp pilus assembly protein TadD
MLEELNRRAVLKMAGLYLVASWVILQIADLLFDAFEVPSWSIRLLFSLILLGFPLVLTLSWIYEFTPAGLRRHIGTGRDLDSGGFQHKITITIVVLLVVAIGIAITGYIVPGKVWLPESLVDEVPRAPKHSIAVLPFLNLSDDPNNVYFSEGLSEELLNILEMIQELDVTARTSSFAFKNKNVDIRTIGRQLNVTNVLEGSVRKSGEQVRITAQLINAESGYHLWSTTYDRTLNDVFAVQDEIAAAVAEALRITLLDEAPRSRVTDPQAYVSYLEGTHFYSQRSSSGYEKAVKAMLAVLAIDPEYSPAWITLSSSYSNMAIYGQLPRKEAYELALSAANRALDIDPDAPRAVSARAWLAMNYERDFASAAEYYRRALQLAPRDPVIQGGFAVLASQLGKLKLAIELSEASIALNPISTVGFSNLSDQYLRNGQVSDALAAAQKAIELTPGNQVANANLAIAHLINNEPEQSVIVADKLTSEYLKTFMHALAFQELGRLQEAEASLAELEHQFADTHAIYIACVYARRGNKTSSFKWLERAIDEDQGVSGIRAEPLLRNLFEDPRWNPLLARIGLSDEQVEEIELFTTESVSLL